MKKSLILLGLLGLQQAFAQTGNVGINTDNPTQALDVNGNARIRTLEEETSSTNFPYQVVAKTDGTLGKRANPKWILFDTDINNAGSQLLTYGTKTITSSSDAVELSNSELFITIPNKATDKIKTLISWNLWLHIIPKTTNAQSGSFRFFAKYQEVDDNNQLIGNPSYTGTIYMVSFSGTKITDGSTDKGTYRVNSTPMISDAGKILKPGKKYKVSLLIAGESMTNEIKEIKTWNTYSHAQVYYKN